MDIDTACAAIARSEKRTYTVWFERIGAHGSIPPLDVEASDLTGLTEGIRVYAQARRENGRVTVDLDVNARTGELRDQDGELGHFVVSVDRLPVGGLR